MAKRLFIWVPGLVILKKTTSTHMHKGHYKWPPKPS